MKIRSTGIALALLLASQGTSATAQMPDVYADDDIWLMEESSQDSPENARTNQATVSENPNAGNSGPTAPAQTLEGESGRDCREFQKTVTIGGHQQQAYGTACRRADGVWEIVRSEEVAGPPS